MATPLDGPNPGSAPMIVPKKQPTIANMSVVGEKAMLEGFTPFPPEFAQRYRAKGYWLDQPLATYFHDRFVEFGERLTAKVRDQEARLPVGYVLDFATFQPTLVQKALGCMKNLPTIMTCTLAAVRHFLLLTCALLIDIV